MLLGFLRGLLAAGTSGRARVVSCTRRFQLGVGPIGQSSRAPIRWSAADEHLQLRIVGVRTADFNLLILIKGKSGLGIYELWMQIVVGPWRFGEIDGGVRLEWIDFDWGRLCCRTQACGRPANLPVEPPCRVLVLREWSRCGQAAAGRVSVLSGSP